MGAVAVSRTSDCTDDDDESNALKILYDRLKCGEPSTADALLVLHFAREALRIKTLIRISFYLTLWT